MKMPEEKMFLDDLDLRVSLNFNLELTLDLSSSGSSISFGATNEITFEWLCNSSKVIITTSSFL